MAFKSTHWFLKKNINDTSFSDEDQKGFRKQINSGINKLNDEYKSKASNFIFKEKMQSFWYRPEYSGPTDILYKCNRKDLIFNYQQLSSSSHGGLVGLSIMKDEPDTIHPNPRADKKSQNPALFYSCRLMIETFFIRGHFEGNEIFKSEVSNRFMFFYNELKKFKTLIIDTKRS